MYKKVKLVLMNIDAIGLTESELIELRDCLPKKEKKTRFKTLSNEEIDRNILESI